MLSLATGNACIRSALGLVSLSTTDQVLSSLSNLVITVAVARATGVEGLGRFALAFVAYLTVLGIYRALVSEPLLAQPRDDEDAPNEAAAVTLTVAITSVGGLVVATLGVLFGRVELVVVAAGLPVTGLHDILRYQAFRRRRTGLAVVLDAGWLAGSMLAWPVVIHTGSPAVALGCWAGAALLGVTLVWPALRPRMLGVRAAYSWWRGKARRTAIPLVIDSVIVALSMQSVVVVLAAFAGDGALGLLRAGQVYFGPVTLTLTAIGVAVVPRLASRHNLPTMKVAALLSASMATLAATACGVVILTEPLLRAVLYADSIQVPPGLLVPLACQTLLAATAGGFVIVAKARRRADHIPRSRLPSTVIGIGLVTGASYSFGVIGAAWALCAQFLLYLLSLAFRTYRADRARTATNEGSQECPKDRVL